MKRFGLKEFAMVAWAYALYDRAKELNLEFGHEDVSKWDLLLSFNGAGAEWMPKKMRKSLTKISESLLPAIFIHDTDYGFGDGTYADFQEANARLERNGRICADAVYGWYNPMRYIVRWQARIYARTCNAVGLPAYKAAIEKTKTKNKEVIYE